MPSRERTISRLGFFHFSFHMRYTVFLERNCKHFFIHVGLVKINSLTTYSRTIRVFKLKSATMGIKLNGKLFRLNGKAFRVNGELIRVHGKAFHVVFSSCEGSFFAIIGMFGWVLHRFWKAIIRKPFRSI